MSANITQLLDKKKMVLEYVEGSGEHGSPLYAYLLLPKNKLASFRHALATKDVNLPDFGTVVAYGHHKQPPQGFDQKVLNAIAKQSA